MPLKSKQKIPENSRRKSLDLLQVSIIKNKGDNFYLRFANKENMKLSTNRMGLKKLPNMIQQSLNQ